MRAAALERVAERGRGNRRVAPAGGAQLAQGARDVEIRDSDDVHAAGQPGLGQEHGAELARSDQADGDRPAGGLPLEQHGVEIHRHIARVTKISVGHSPSLGVRRSSRILAGHLSSDWVSRLLPPRKPLPRQSVSAAAWQSGLPFCAGAERSRALTTRAFGSPITAPVASLAASKVWLPNLSNVSCALCMSDLNLVVPSSSQRPKVSIKPGLGARLGSSGGGGNRLGTPRCGTRLGAWLGGWPGAWVGGAVGACVSCASAGRSRSSAQAAAHAIVATPRTPIVP